MRTRFVPLLAVALALPLLSAVPADAGDQQIGASCTGPQEITVSWSWSEYEQSPTGHPEWTGWDVLRMKVGVCDTWERLNATPLPRIVGQSYTTTFVDTPPAMDVAYAYRAIPVDADRHLVQMLAPACDPPCVKTTWVGCPEATTPIAIGTVEDWGWTLYVQGCASSCSLGGYLVGSIVDELRGQGRVGTVIKLYGGVGGWGIEGPALIPTEWAPGNCSDILPIARPTWGGVKTIYR